MFKESGVFEVDNYSGDQTIKINHLLKDKYEEQLKRLSFYAVDIRKKGISDEEKLEFMETKLWN